jgi:hypothetical protein
MAAGFTGGKPEAAPAGVRLGALEVLGMAAPYEAYDNMKRNRP